MNENTLIHFVPYPHMADSSIGLNREYKLTYTVLL